MKMLTIPAPSEGEFTPITKRAPEALLKRLVLDAAGAIHATPFARMRLRGDLTESQYSAGNWFAELEKSYREALCSPKGIQTSTGERHSKSNPLDPFSPVGWDIAVAERKAIRKFDDARRAGMECGRDKFKLFWFIAIEGGAPVGYTASTAVREVCSALDKHRTRAQPSTRNRLKK